jgi:hypothetical protein
MTQYDAKDCVITFNGVYITGLGEDMVTGAKDEEFFSTSVGAQGDVVVSETNNDLGTITLTVQVGSPQFAMLIEAAKAGTIAPMWVTNKSIGEKFGGTQARFKNYPELENGAEASERQFKAQVFDYEVDNI